MYNNKHNRNYKEIGREKVMEFIYSTKKTHELKIMILFIYIHK